VLTIVVSWLHFHRQPECNWLLGFAYSWASTECVFHAQLGCLWRHSNLFWKCASKESGNLSHLLLAEIRWILTTKTT